MKKYKSVVDEIEKTNEENKKLMEQECKIKLHKIKIDTFPELTLNQIEILMPIIDDEEGKMTKVPNLKNNIGE